MPLDVYVPLHLFFFFFYFSPLYFSNVSKSMISQSPRSYHISSFSAYVPSPLVLFLSYWFVYVINCIFYQAQILCKFLQAINRTDIAVGIGLSQDNYVGPLYGWAQDYNLNSYPGIFPPLLLPLTLLSPLFPLLPPLPLLLVVYS